MKKTFGIVVATVVFVIMIAGSAMALTVDITRTVGYFFSTGGEFTITPSADLAYVLDNYADDAKLLGGTAFESFCIERYEHAQPLPNTYDAVINDEAIGGGVNHGIPGIDGGDVISVGTAWLYMQFAHGTLPGYDYTPGAGRIASAGLLQAEIYSLEDELPSPANIFTAAVIAKFGSAAAARANNIPGGYGVAALNLYVLGSDHDIDDRKQDQLVMVPEPFTLVLLGLGLVGLAGLRRKF